MDVFELSIKAYCLKDILKKDVFKEIDILIDSCLMQDEEMKKLHLANSYKYYTFNALYPLEKGGIYQRGKIYTFILRTANAALKDYFYNELPKQYSHTLKLLTAEDKQISKRHIHKLYSITPIILKFDTGYWRDQYTFEVFEKRIRENLIKKYNAFNHIKLEEDFELFTYLKIENQKPITFEYKNVILLGDKITAHVAENDTAQKLAYMAIASGLGEMGSRGAGFVNFQYL